jgi:hypothetical protein
MTTTVNQANHECFTLMLSQRGVMGVAMRMGQRRGPTHKSGLRRPHQQAGGMDGRRMLLLPRAAYDAMGAEVEDRRPVEGAMV